MTNLFELFSLSEQRERLEAYCKFNDYEIIEYYTDAGISAKTGNHRPEYERMLEDGKNGKINMFIALKLDRVTRSIKDWESLIEFSEKYDINLAFVNDKIDKLKISKLNKDNYILSKEDKESFIDFINIVDDTNKQYDKIQNLSTTLTNVDDQIKDKNNKIKTLTENNEALNLRINKLNNLIKEKDEEISFLKSKISDLKDTLEYWQKKFNKIISFIHGKIHNWFDKDDKYIDVVNEMYQDDVLDDNDINDLDLSKNDNFKI